MRSRKIQPNRVRALEATDSQLEIINSFGIRPDFFFFFFLLLRLLAQKDADRNQEAFGIKVLVDKYNCFLRFVWQFGLLGECSGEVPFFFFFFLKERNEDV